MNTVTKIECPELKGTIARLAQLNGEIPGAMARGMRRFGEQVAREAKECTPVDTGALRSSIHTITKRTGTKIETTIGAGGPAGSGNLNGETNTERVGYAVYVHENLAAHHEVGGPKYLEQPLMEALSQLDTEMAEELDKTIAKMRSR